MRINIYYGGRGLIEDSTIYVLNKLTEVLEELRVEVTRYNLYEDLKGINMLPNTLKEADGVILATTVEWFGIGGLMQQFLDACWLYGDKEKIQKLSMLPIAISTTYGERDAIFTLTKLWELLGGVPCEGICAYVDNHVEFETDPEYAFLIEKKAEMIYRQVSHRLKNFPTSAHIVNQTMLKGHSMELTPQESEQLSIYVSDDTYVKKQKEDIQELAQLFKGMLGDEENPETDTEGEFIKDLKEHFKGQAGIFATYHFNFADEDKNLFIKVSEDKVECYYDEKGEVDVFVKMSKDIMLDIIEGKMTLQKAFMSGEVTAKGDFETLRNFDTLFKF